MHDRVEQKFIKLNADSAEHLAFLRSNVRDFYSKDIVLWQYRNQNTSVGLYFKERNGKVIASQGMIPISLNSQKNILRTAKSESSFLIAEERGLGHFEDLYFHTVRCAEKDGIEIIWGFTALSNFWRKKLNFSVFEGVIHETDLQISFKKSLYEIRASDQTLLYKLKAYLKSVFALLRARKKLYENTSLKAVELDINEYSQMREIVDLYRLWEENHLEYIRMCCDEEYLKWRILKNPVSRYKVIGIYRNKLTGYGIINTSGNYYYLVDFITEKDEDLETCFITMLNHIRRKFNPSHLVYWGSSKNDYCNSIHRLFKKFGAFRYTNRSMNFVIRVTSKSSIVDAEIPRYYLNGLWTEGFKI